MAQCKFTVTHPFSSEIALNVLLLDGKINTKTLYFV